MLPVLVHGGQGTWVRSDLLTGRVLEAMAMCQDGILRRVRRLATPLNEADCARGQVSKASRTVSGSVRVPPHLGALDSDARKTVEFIAAPDGRNADLLPEQPRSLVTVEGPLREWVFVD